MDFHGFRTDLITCYTVVTMTLCVVRSEISCKLQFDYIFVRNKNDSNKLNFGRHVWSGAAPWISIGSEWYEFMTRAEWEWENLLLINKIHSTKMANERANDAPKQSEKKQKENQHIAMKSWRGLHTYSFVGMPLAWHGLTVSICCFVSLVNVNSVEQRQHQPW